MSVSGVGVGSTSTESGPRLSERALSLAELERSRSALPVFSVRDIAPDRLFVDSGVAVGIDQ